MPSSIDDRRNCVETFGDYRLHAIVVSIYVICRSARQGRMFSTGLLEFARCTIFSILAYNVWRAVGLYSDGVQRLENDQLGVQQLTGVGGDAWSMEILPTVQLQWYRVSKSGVMDLSEIRYDRFHLALHY